MECESCQFTWCEEATPRTGFHFQSCVNGLVVLNKDRRTYDCEHQNECLDLLICQCRTRQFTWGYCQQFNRANVNIIYTM